MSGADLSSINGVLFLDSVVIPNLAPSLLPPGSAWANPPQNAFDGSTTTLTGPAPYRYFRCCDNGSGSNSCDVAEVQFNGY